MNSLLLVILAIYNSASIALGFNASKLTHGDIVSRGPYTIVCHPAHICVAAVLWVGVISFVGAQFQYSALAGLLAIGSIIALGGIHVLRALTEEDHLCRVDGHHNAYAAKIHSRSIPGLI